jgi:hypothetical protein
MQRQEDLAGILTPEEMRIHEMSTSPLAEKLRHDLSGFEPSQGEFDAIFQVRKSYEEVLAASLGVGSGLTAEAWNEGMSEASLALEAEMRQVLGEARYAEYAHASDPDWRLLTGELGISDTVAAQVYSMKRQAERQKIQVEANSLLNPAQRQQVLLAIQKETQDTLSQVLGPDSFNQYRIVGGNWIEELGLTAPGQADVVDPVLPRPPAAPMPPIQRGSGALPAVIEILVPTPVPAGQPPFPVRQ